MLDIKPLSAISDLLRTIIGSILLSTQYISNLSTNNKSGSGLGATTIINLSIVIFDVPPISGFIPNSIFRINSNNFICDNEISFTSNIIRSVEELNIFKQYFDIPHEAYTKYDEEYFKTNSLVVFKDIIKKQLNQYDMAIVNFDITNRKIYFYYKKT